MNSLWKSHCHCFLSNPHHHTPSPLVIYHFQTVQLNFGRLRCHPIRLCPIASTAAFQLSSKLDRAPQYMCEMCERVHAQSYLRWSFALVLLPDPAQRWVNLSLCTHACVRVVCAAMTVHGMGSGNKQSFVRGAGMLKVIPHKTIYVQMHVQHFVLGTICSHLLFFSASIESPWLINYFNIDLWHFDITTNTWILHFEIKKISWQHNNLLIFYFILTVIHSSTCLCPIKHPTMSWWTFLQRHDCFSALWWNFLFSLCLFGWFIDSENHQDFYNALEVQMDLNSKVLWRELSYSCCSDAHLMRLSITFRQMPPPSVKSLFCAC